MELSSSIKPLDLNSTISLLLGFLKENNLNETLTALSSETGVAFSYIPHRQEFLENIKRGAWHHVLKTIESVKLEISTV